MLRLFQSIFALGREEPGRYPESLVEAAIDRAVDATDPRLRVLSGYRKRLRGPVLGAIDHVVRLVDEIPPPVDAGRRGYGADPRLAALFASPDSMLETFGHDRSLGAALRDRPHGAGSFVALLAAEKAEQNVLGMDLQGDMLRREVAQVSVSFTGHRLLDPTASEEETRRLLKRRAFDHLLALALGRIVDAREERTDLERQRGLLRQKLTALKAGRWSFEEGEDEAPTPEAIAADLDRIEGELGSLGADAGSLQAHLEILVGLLEQAQQQLWAGATRLILDRMNIRHERPTGAARELTFPELYNARGRSLAMLLVAIPAGDLPEREDMLSAAQRYLG